MKKVPIWYQSAESDWALIMSMETDRTITEVSYDGMGFPITQSADSIAMKVVKDLITGVILKPSGSSKWLKQVEQSFLECWKLSRDYIAQSELKGITPRVYVINDFIK